MSTPLVSALLHYFLAVMIGVYYWKVLERQPRPLIFMPAMVCSLLHAVYFAISAVKYFDPNTYYFMYSYLSEETRLFGSFLSSLIILGMISIAGRQKKLLSQSKPQTVHIVLQLLGVLTFTLFSFGLILKYLLLKAGYGSTYAVFAGRADFSLLEVNQYGDRFLLFLSWVNSMVLLAMSALLCWRPQAERGTFLQRLGGILIFLSELSWAAIFWASRMQVVTGILLFLMAYQNRNRKRGAALLFVLIPAAPFLAVLFSTQFLRVLGREESWSTSLGSIAEISYRVNLTDFAMGLLSETNGWPSAPGVLSDALINALPRVILSRKDDLMLDSYYEQFRNIGWPAGFDYPDTLFSSGVMLGGWVGFFLLPLLFVVVLRKLSDWLTRRRDLSGLRAYLTLILACSATYIELGAGELFLWYRHFIMYTAVFLAVYCVLVFVTRKALGLSSAEVRP